MHINIEDFFLYIHINIENFFLYIQINIEDFFLYKILRISLYIYRYKYERFNNFSLYLHIDINIENFFLYTIKYPQPFYHPQHVLPIAFPFIPQQNLYLYHTNLCHGPERQRNSFSS